MFGVGDVGALTYSGLNVGSAYSMEWLQELGVPGSKEGNKR